MIGVVIPACNEEDHIEACLQSIQAAIAVLDPCIKVKIMVVLDSCEDQTLHRVMAMQVPYLCCTVRCVGQARDLGVRALLEQGATWVACTDADSRVNANWLKQQLHHQPTDLICGVVYIDDWQNLSAQTQSLYMGHYQDRMGHRHIHGANLSFSGEAYLAVGGFHHLKCHEDVDLVQRMLAADYTALWSNQVRVATSSRLHGRAQDGFADFLNNLHQQQVIEKSEQLIVLNSKT